MLTVVIETRNDEDGLARTLSPLVPGAVEGVVLEVIVCDHGSTDQVHKVAEHAGCRFLTSGGIAPAMRQAKGEWLLFLEPGARLVEGWIGEVRDHAAGSTMPARFSRARGKKARFWERLFSSRRGLAEGLLITKRQALSKRSDTIEALLRGLSTRRLDAEIHVAPARKKVA